LPLRVRLCDVAVSTLLPGLNIAKLLYAATYGYRQPWQAFWPPLFGELCRTWGSGTSSQRLLSAARLLGVSSPTLP